MESADPAGLHDVVLRRCLRALFPRVPHNQVRRPWLLSVRRVHPARDGPADVLAIPTEDPQTTAFCRSAGLAAAALGVLDRPGGLADLRHPGACHGTELPFSSLLQ